MNGSLWVWRHCFVSPESFEKFLIGGGVLDDELGPAVDGKDLGMTGGAQLLDVFPGVPVELGQGQDVRDSDHCWPSSK